MGHVNLIDLDAGGLRSWRVCSPKDLPEASPQCFYSARSYGDGAVRLTEHPVTNPKTPSGGVSVKTERGHATFHGRSRYCETPEAAIKALVERMRRQHRHRLVDAARVEVEIGRVTRQFPSFGKPVLSTYPDVLRRVLFPPRAFDSDY